MLSPGLLPQKFISGNPRKPLSVPFNFMQIYQIHDVPESSRKKSKSFSDLSLVLKRYVPLNLKKGNASGIHYIKKKKKKVS